MFTRKLVNRLNMPTKTVLVCEDDLQQQARIAVALLNLFGHQSDVQVVFVPGGEYAAAVVEWVQEKVAVILLDHDMPYGDGVELLEQLKEWGVLDQIKVITFSGIPQNNKRLMQHGAHHEYTKDQVINGEANREILAAVGK